MSIPLKDSLLVPFTTNFNARIVAHQDDYQLTDVQVEAYTPLSTAFVTAYNTMVNARADGTRAKSQTDAKDTAKNALLAYARELYKTIQANTAVTEANKTLLGIHVQSGGPSPKPAPTERPLVTIKSAIVRTVTINVQGVGEIKAGARPRNATGAFVYAFVGESYPSDPTTWQFMGVCTKNPFEITLPNTVAGGSLVWVSAAWVGTRGEAGPPSIPLSINVPGGGAGEEGAMKIAA